MIFPMNNEHPVANDQFFDTTENEFNEMSNGYWFMAVIFDGNMLFYFALFFIHFN